jgi:branched-chain amino acid transport system permease protein
MIIFIQQLVNGLGIAAALALVAMGISLIFGTSGVINFAQADFMMLGAFIAFAVAQSGAGLAVGTLVATLSLAVIGAIIYLVLFRQVRGHPVNGFILSIGLSILLENIAQQIWGGLPQVYGPVLDGVWKVGPFTFLYTSLVLLVGAVVILLVVFLLLFKTPFGRMVRACLDDRDAAALIGIPLVWVEVTVFALAAAIGGCAGGLLLLQYPVSPYLGTEFLILAFAAALLGGLRRPIGVLIGAAIIGIVDSISIQYGQGIWSYFYVYVIVIAVLLWRPQGLVGGRS